MEPEEIQKLTALLNDRTMKLMERESELADKFEELEAQKEELTAAVEELMHTNRELVERNQELDAILYRSSHDLKSPLTSMFGVLNLIKAEKLPDHLKDYCIHLEQRMQQMNSVINTLTLLGKSVLDEIKLKQISISNLIADEIEQLRYLPNFKLITFEKQFEGPDHIFADDLLTRILIRSLLSNAIVFRSATPGKVLISVNTGNQALNIVIKDDGEGISPEVAPNIWDMFYRGSERSIGQGMGLYLVKKIIHRLHGNIWYRSQEGFTIFELLIPLTPPPTV